jgi:hypothetical protein
VIALPDRTEAWALAFVSKDIFKLKKQRAGKT